MWIYWYLITLISANNTYYALINLFRSQILSSSSSSRSAPQLISESWSPQRTLSTHHNLVQPSTISLPPSLSVICCTILPRLEVRDPSPFEVMNDRTDLRSILADVLRSFSQPWVNARRSVHNLVFTSMSPLSYNRASGRWVGIQTEAGGTATLAKALLATAHGS